MSYTNWSKAIMLLVAVLLFSSCKDQKGSDYTNMIPADAEWVTSVNLKSIHNKADMSNEAKAQIVEALKQEVGNEMQDYLKQFIDDPATTGIDISAPIYSFEYLIDGENFPAVVMKVKDTNKVKQSLEYLINERLLSSIEQEGDVYTIEDFCMFDQSKLIVFGYTNRKFNQEVQKGVFNQSYENSLASTESFKKFASKKTDLNFFMSGKTLLEKSKSYIPRTMMRGYDAATLKDVFYLVSLNFDKGAILVEANIISNDPAVTAKFKEQANLMNTIKHSFISYFPENTLMYAAININGQAFVEQLEKQNEDKLTLNKEEINTIKDFAAAIKGDICFGVTDVSMMSADFIAYADADKETAIAVLDKYASSEINVEAIDKNIYSMRVGYAYEMIFGYKDNYLFITTSKDIYDELGKKHSPSFGDVRYASEMKGKDIYMVIDIQNILNNEAVKSLVSLIGGEAKTYAKLLSNISHININSEDALSAKIEVHLSNENTNSLQQIIGITKQYAGL